MERDKMEMEKETWETSESEEFSKARKRQ